MKRQRYGDPSDTSDEPEDVPQRQKELAWLGLRGEQVTHKQMTVGALPHPGKVGEGVVVSRQNPAEHVSCRSAQRRGNVWKRGQDGKREPDKPNISEGAGNEDR